MVDVSQFEPHVRKAIEDMDLAGDTLKRAREGMKWLNEHAPPDWRLQMISIREGRVTSRVRLAYNDENPLALAFRHVDGFQGADGRATWAIVASKLQFGGNRYDAEQKGFIEKSHRVGSVFISTDIDGSFLDAAWAAVLGDWQWMAAPVSRTVFGLEHVRADRNMRGHFYPAWYKRPTAQARSA